jgi:hypothetical protein
VIFPHFLREKLAFFLKKFNVMIQILKQIAAYRTKERHFFAQIFFCENIFKIRNLSRTPGR